MAETRDNNSCRVLTPPVQHPFV